MKHRDLREFIDFLEQRGELKRISAEVDPHLEMTEICDRVLRAGGPARDRAKGNRSWLWPRRCLGRTESPSRTPHRS